MDVKFSAKTALLAGKILMENNAEMHRIEDCIQRIGATDNIEITSYTTQTGIFINIEAYDIMLMKNITHRVTNLEKIAQVNQAIRDFSTNHANITTLHNRLKEIEAENFFFPAWLEVLAAGIVSASLMMLLNGKLSDLLPTFIIGSLSYIIYLSTSKHFGLKFLAEILAAIAIGSLAALCRHYSWITQINAVVNGAVMPLVPGVLITNSIRDLLSGHLISGLSRGAEATITVLMIAFGIVFTLKLF
ncbi:MULTISPECIES: threonine/serine exporter family protein [unclassified Enterococcus]|uniref:threonine/serine exporter family protein n=1 Tax=unclassified Enterococcus TaxID=2608891 RepID=UPI001554557A|nr:MULTISPECIES: threonine/serine exporter family protein [unclassified Enterococcus]MBS7577869.1 threonine/serine exporter family protein [Enterococcus sp. MMGLQ5-2]MBS7585129.1 threonine/serine exporter family protein [Enterococcus sp. MMGLQ5-1]NPD12985.1 threonine/serine exporter family protein [Enterococcus sp. MMGLQ5-1]NPD37699.1 threonine/serine exporter family protein [Enterococcus sp. MMGLQ5-2]